MNAGERIKEMRIKYGYRQADLAGLIGCSAQVISNIERGVTDISADIALRIADVFHTPVKNFLTENRPQSVVLSPEEYSLVSYYRKLLPNERKLLLQMFGLFMANQK
jgi:putative transcriptional regulator